ncbi:tRNA (adenosine(37)-N6)-threonylcarbamoyltransferase complex ATPase subunit type 1 TsaE [Candidatus Pseudomonas adelgestsugas]|uniref:tRNA threonylcarbamoyladenosine biosynthesis protein TsaE n=1 Tax=Candidatus Pseudomonas adelgestsugas TaxID=1302376 RepID=A0ABX5R7X7_9PSED|nr:tRNA (adenosine(37)-N6)-threonylcarbamoyltransferase complex ATPase subunit type 1 TsaE [Candidatus Pseudomonas adelgestsugas]QAX81589.1 tRNA threonylcarbamoyladenosine biosynthesis protein TsaE [Candidatus Pseudomonas adelgestsugas]
MFDVTLLLADENAMVLFGHRIAQVTTGVGLVFIEGDLGVGKTTLSRGIIRGLGYIGVVKSPTFTLVEPYEIGVIRAYHFDLYRLIDHEELEYMGIRDYLEKDALCLIEWPDKNICFLPKPDLTITIIPHKYGRHLTLLPHSMRGQFWCIALALEF